MTGPDRPTRAALARQFRDPPPEYGPIDGWWWEAGRLDRDKLRWQLEELRDKGISGTWFYARFLYGEPLGSQPPYFSDEWWEFTRFAAQEHQRLGLIDWFSNWTALQFEQGAIRAQREANPALWGRRLVIFTAAADEGATVELTLGPDDELVDAAAYRFDGEVVDHGSRVPLTDSVRDQRLEWRAAGPGWLLTAVAARPWDLDYLGPQVGRLWTDVVLAEYERRLPELIGGAISAFGPDEMSLVRGTTMFSTALLDKIRAEHGYDPVPELVGLFFDIGPRTERIRCSYYDAMLVLLEEHFYQSEARWLHERGMRYVSLSQMNEDPIEQTFHYGDFFRYMRHFDAPGNEDPLARPPGQRRIIQTKMSSSIAHLYGRQRSVLLGHYGSGWGHTLDENVAWTNESYAKGLNLYSRHLASYSLMGGWYEYVPPSDHFYHPYWRYWRTFADYVRRLSFILSQGKHRADAAVLYPLASLHAHWKAPSADQPDDELGVGFATEPHQVFEEGAFEASQGMETVARAIYDAGIDFDFVDDSSLQRAEIRGEALDIAGVELRSVVLPPMSTIRRSTMTKIKEFHDRGGTVVAFGRLPVASAEAGRDDPALQALLDSVFHAGSPRGVLVTEDASQIAKVIAGVLRPDVVATGSGVFHTHQRIGDLDVYFLFNVLDDERDLRFELWTEGKPEVWDPWTGDTRPVHRFGHAHGTTWVRMHLRPFEGITVVLSPGSSASPAVVNDNLLEIAAIEAMGDAVELHGFDDAGGSKRARLIHQDREYQGSIGVEPPPPPVQVDGPFSFRLEPTMDNRWGDFRYPASSEVIGAEARTFRYREEGTVAGVDLGWHTTDLEDSDWPEVTYSYGPYWWHLGPLAQESEPAELLDRAKRGDPELPWSLYSFSKQFGSNRRVDDAGPLAWFRHLLGVSSNHLVLDTAATDTADDHHHYLFTTVHAPNDGERLLLVGGKARHPEVSGLAPDEGAPPRVAKGTRAWVNGEEVLAVEDGVDEARARVVLRAGRNSVLIKLVYPRGGQAAGYAVLLESEPAPPDPLVPLLEWFREPQRLIYDVNPDAVAHVGWYRFDAPPGLRRMRLRTAARGVRAWVDGVEVPVRDGVASLDAARPSVSHVALRVDQEPGTYAGAAFVEPVAFECEQGTIPLGDWTRFGLATYSGIGLYKTEVALTGRQLDGKVLLDLGQVKTVAEVSVNGRPAGTRISRPFRFDITDLVHEGDNRIEIKVANTLANHMSTYPTKWVFDGQTVSGLLGPVELRFLAPVRLVAVKSS
jgi:alpha-L-rhamnosidase/Glycosyl hydrolases family 2, sugar binding domain